MDKLDANLEQQFDLNLIEAVKMNPVIYDRSHYNYKHFVRKAQTWKQIAETLGVSGKWNFRNLCGEKRVQVRVRVLIRARDRRELHFVLFHSLWQVKLVGYIAAELRQAAGAGGWRRRQRQRLATTVSSLQID